MGKLTYRGRPVNPASIKRMGLMTVEGEKDESAQSARRWPHRICAPVSALTAKYITCRPASGITACSAGRRWNNEIYPLLRGFRARQFVTSLHRHSRRRN